MDVSVGEAVDPGGWLETLPKLLGKLGGVSPYDRIAGNREQFVGRLQERYGIKRDQAERDIDAWARDLDETRFTTPTY